MSERGPSRIRLAVLLVTTLTTFAALVAAISCWLRASIRPENDPTDSELPAPTFPFVPVARAKRIAIDEVKRREGWSGKTSDPLIDGAYWFVYVRSQRKSQGEREVMIDAYDGRLMSYQVLSEKEAYHERPQYYHDSSGL
jgi:hypothetical protein